MSSGREFHTTGPETRKLLGPKRRDYAARISFQSAQSRKATFGHSMAAWQGEATLQILQPPILQRLDLKI